MDDQTKYDFIVDSTKYDNDKETLTGAEIKAKVPGFNPTYQLYLEQQGDEADKLIADGEKVSLDHDHHGIRKFYSVPPATFGAL
jgi:hypothetical protein